MPATRPLIEPARAKVNLTLRVLGRRADGFHELESIVAFAGVGDILELTPAPSPAVSVTGPFAAAIDGENLVGRALALLAEADPGLVLGHISIDKSLPVAAGIGGGSADAAAALRLIARANPGRATAVDWRAIASRLGSDVPVCFADQACRMTGRGEMLAPIAGFPPLPAVLVNPQAPVPTDKTRQVFTRLAAPLLLATPHPGLPFPSTVKDWLALLRNSTNDLQPAATSVIPAIAQVQYALEREAPAGIARLSGAGPTCFALVPTQKEAEALATRIAARYPLWWVRATTLS